MLKKTSNFDPERFLSAKRLKADDKYTPCVVNNGDELYPNGIFVFNITRMYEFLETNPNEVGCVEVEVSDFPNSFSSINESHVDSVDISAPVIIAEISPGRYNLIDGNHRMEKARRMGIQKISAYKFDVKLLLKFFTNDKGYRAYINYWNDKCA